MMRLLLRTKTPVGVLLRKRAVAARMRSEGISDVHDLDYASLSLRCGLRRGPAIAATPPLPQMRGFFIF